MLTHPKGLITQRVLELTLAGKSAAEIAKELQKEFGRGSIDTVFTLQSKLRKEGRLPKLKPKRSKFGSTEGASEQPVRSRAEATDVLADGPEVEKPHKRRVTRAEIFDRFDKNVPDIEIAKEFDLSDRELFTYKAEYFRIKGLEPLARLYERKPEEINSLIEVTKHLASGNIPPSQALEKVKNAGSLANLEERRQQARQAFEQQEQKLDAVSERVRIKREEYERLLMDKKKLDVEVDTLSEKAARLQDECNKCERWAEFSGIILRGKRERFIRKNPLARRVLAETIFRWATDLEIQNLTGELPWFRKHEPGEYERLTEEKSKLFLEDFYDRLMETLEA
jgi:hypothetical protein